MPGMRPTAPWDRSRLKGEKGPVGAVGAPEPSLCAGSLWCEVSVCAPCDCDGAPCVLSLWDDAPWTVSPWGGALWEGAYGRERGPLGPVARGGAPRGGVPGGRNPGTPGCEASLFCSCATARRSFLEPAPMRGDPSGEGCSCDASSVGSLRAGAVPCGSARSARSCPSARKVQGVGLEPATSSIRLQLLNHSDTAADTNLGCMVRALEVRVRCVPAGGGALLNHWSAPQGLGVGKIA